MSEQILRLFSFERAHMRRSVHNLCLLFALIGRCMGLDVTAWADFHRDVTFCALSSLLLQDGLMLGKYRSRLGFCDRRQLDALLNIHDFALVPVVLRIRSVWHWWSLLDSQHLLAQVCADVQPMVAKR